MNNAGFLTEELLPFIPPVIAGAVLVIAGVVYTIYRYLKDKK